MFFEVTGNSATLVFMLELHCELCEFANDTVAQLSPTKIDRHASTSIWLTLATVIENVPKLEVFTLSPPTPRRRLPVPDPVKLCGQKTSTRWFMS